MPDYQRVSVSGFFSLLVISNIVFCIFAAAPAEFSGGKLNGPSLAEGWDVVKAD